MRPIDAPDQCVILVGGLGTRLGALTADVPKPLLPVGDKPFLDELLWRAKRFGFRRVLLLAGYRAEKVLDYVRDRRSDPQFSIDVIVEPEPLGTAGALALAKDRLDPWFLLLNGDSLFDFNWLDLVPLAARHERCVIAMALRKEADASRFGVVDIAGEQVVGFKERGTGSEGLINGGVYLLSRDILADVPEAGSLERDVLPRLAVGGRVFGREQSGFFLDIGVPEAYRSAPRLLEANRVRPAIFLDRDGVLNEDGGYVHRIEDFIWIPGAVDAVKAANDQNFFVFVVTNQAGVARGFYTEDQVHVLHGQVQQALRNRGAHFDDLRYCPFHPDGTLAEYAKMSNWRKPEAGMILDLLNHWPVDVPRSLLIGDKDSDVEAAARAGIRGHRFPGGNLASFVNDLLR